MIAQVVATLPLAPGVYRMLNAKGDVLYVGKARSLKKRVVYYTDPARLPERLKRMVFETVAMEIITVPSEAEALLLEANLIKKLAPKYNILLRDDKSYPWLLLTEDSAFPQIAKHRGARARQGSYFGPFASAWAVNQSITALQRLFQLRTCEDSVFANRTRPCLLHQIKRCAAPCVDRISAADYAVLVAQAKEFLGGHSADLQKHLAADMERAAEALDFERAAYLRDRIRALTAVQTSGIASASTIDNADIFAVHQAAGQTSVQVFFIRGGHNNGNRAFYPVHAETAEPAEVLEAFIPQFYEGKPVPPLILLSHDLAERELLAEALSIHAKKRIEISVPQRGEKRSFVEHAQTNAREALERKLAEATGQARHLAAIARLFNLSAPPRRIEVYDNSHLMGKNAYGAMIVAGPEGFLRKEYRKFGIKGAITPGDDFAMMREVLTRRFTRALRENTLGENALRENTLGENALGENALGEKEREGEAGWPDLVLIDGGAGQLSAAQAIFDELGLDDIKLVAISKGPDRDAGREWFHQTGQPPFQLPPRDPNLYYLQRLRDEAHRFVIGTHRAARSKNLTGSELDTIPGIGPARKKALLHHFGSARAVKAAGLNELEAAPGIDKTMAGVIHRHFQER